MIALDALTALFKTPLRLIGVFDVGIFTLALVLSVYYLRGRIAYGTPLPGFTTLVLLTLFFHSFTFIFLGLLAEYLSRIFDDAKERPRVVVAEALNMEKFPRIL